MKNKIVIPLLIFFSFSTFLFSQEVEIEIPVHSSIIKGTLVQPIDDSKVPLVIIIPGSGATDRNGNNAMMKNNSLKMLATELSKNKIASFRYDKSPLHYPKGVQQDTLTFDSFIYEAKQVVKFFKKEHQFVKIVVAGHSQGSLVGMLAADSGADAFISLAGAGKSIDKVLLSQIATKAPFLASETKEILAKLKKGEKVKEINPMLQPLFNPSIQLFLSSWMKYKPTEEIKKLNIPILIINGTNDLQVSVSNAKKLHEAKLNSELLLIEKMNHILKEVDEDIQKNMQSYNNPDLPISKQLIEGVVTFIHKI